MITFDEVREFLSVNKASLLNLGSKIDDLIMEGRVHKSVPIYVTKFRIKGAESCYLKTKRKKYESLNKISDIVGIRALCLFEQDIIPSFRYILNILINPDLRSTSAEFGFSLSEIICFNWDESAWKGGLMDSLIAEFEHHELEYDLSEARELSSNEIEYKVGYGAIRDDAPSNGFNYRLINKGSGYRSIHFVAMCNGFSFEIQLRTLLQDVWGELEHSLSYKRGFVHPHIANSFQVFSREMQAKDLQMRELRDIRDKERAIENAARFRQGPSHWLDYEESVLCQAFKSRNEIELYRSHASIGMGYRKPDLDSNFISKFTSSLNHLRNTIENVANPVAVHFLQMEEAFLAYCKGDFEAAQEIYRDQFSAGAELPTTLWAVNYRLGEIELAIGQVERALAYFDSCEAGLKTLAEKDGSQRELYYVNSKLAHVYWELGPEFSDLSVGRMKVANSWFDKLEAANSESKEIFGTRGRLLNNYCYFATEGWIDSYRSKKDQKIVADFRTQAKRLFGMLSKYVKDNPELASCNFYDTLAWYCFANYKWMLEAKKQSNKEAIEQLRTARLYLEKSFGGSNYAVSAIASSNLNRRHAEEILFECGKKAIEAK